MKRPRNMLSILLGIMFFLIPITSMMMVNYISVSQTIMNMDRGYQGNYQSGMKIEGTIDKEEFYELICQINDRIAVYQNYLGDRAFSSIYFEGDYVNIPMTEGRFFIEEDFREENYVAVIGKNYLSEVYVEGGTSWIDISDIKFKVLGVMGLKSDSVMDQQVIVNGFVSDEIYHQPVYQLDFLEGDGAKLEQMCLDAVEEAFDVNAEIIFKESGVLESRLPEVLWSRWFIGILAGDILCVLLLSIEWAKEKRAEIAVRRLVGGLPIRIALEMSREYLLMIGTFSGVSFLICYVMLRQYHRYLFTGVAGITVCILMWLFFMWISLFRRSIMEEIK